MLNSRNTIYRHLYPILDNLVVEQTDTLLNEGDAQLLSSLEDGGIVLATSGGGDVLDTGAGSAEDVVNEGEL